MFCSTHQILIFLRLILCIVWLGGNRFCVLFWDKWFGFGRKVVLVRCGAVRCAGDSSYLLWLWSRCCDKIALEEEFFYRAHVTPDSYSIRDVWVLCELEFECCENMNCCLDAMHKRFLSLRVVSQVFDTWYRHFVI